MCPSCPKMRTEPRSRILEALSKFAETSRRGTGSAVVLSKNTNELKTGAPGRFDRHRPVASPRSGACRRRCRRFGFPVRAGKTPSSNGMPRSRAKTWVHARATSGPERASRLRRGSPGLDSGDDPSCGLFSDAARPCQRPAPRLVKIFERPAGQQFVSARRARPVQKHKRTQDWRAGPFRSSSTHGEHPDLGRVGGDVGD